MATATLATLRTKAQERADMVNSDFIGDPEWNRYINTGMRELYDLLVQKYGEDYYTLTDNSITTASGQQDYSLPADFFKLRAVIFNDGGRRYLVKRFKMTEITEGTQYVPYAAKKFTRYRIIGNNIRFEPEPNANIPVTLYYIPIISDLVNDNDTVEGFNGWEEHIVLTAAYKALAKEESDVSEVAAEIAKVEMRIQKASTNRDAVMPSAITDFYNGAAFGDFYAGGW